MNIDAYKGCKRPAGNRHDHALIRCTPERGWFCFACEVESLTAEIEQLRNKLMEGENLAQEFSYFGMRNEIGKKHPALQKRIDDFIKSSFPLLLTKGNDRRNPAFKRMGIDEQKFREATAPASDKDTDQPRTMCNKHGWYDFGPCKYCIEENLHTDDCAIHNYAPTPCDCGAEENKNEGY